MEEPGNQLTVDVITPQTWTQQYHPKSRRVALSHQRRAVFKSKQHKSTKSKELLFQKLLESQSQSLTRRSSTNGSQFDPFQSFPVSSAPSVSHMAQYFLQVWGPQHGRAFAFEGHKNPYLSLLWPFALQTDIYFEALVALCRGTLLVVQSKSAHQDKAFALHRSNVMTKLRRRLQDPEQCADDATILVVATLGTIDYILGDHNAATAHVTGMRQMIKIRGGFKANTPWDRLLQANVTAYESLWSFLFAADTTSNDIIQNASQILGKSELTTYLSHPFPPDVCEMLAKVPRGFSDLGLTGVLSLQIIRLLADFNQLSVQLSSSPVEGKFEMALRPKIQGVLEDLHRLATLQTTPTERFLTNGLVAYCYLIRSIYFDEVLTGFYENALKILAESALKQPPCTRLPDRKCYLWSYTMICTALETSVHPPLEWKSLMPMFLRTYSETNSWKMLKRDLETFFWEDNLAQLCRTAYDEGVRRKKEGQGLSPPAETRHSTMTIRNVVL
ncbi:uncharacterized protein A1O9_08283 [Exophiala aquamarina CBS 119918]|uniref:Transcription factor domain-containing protein n=1 Tax=Exophiala aquamarina CBS 119918 TaxID=1182545 RepID=A0A072P8B0_9EURO|nr:uncharacterized protein A1O9_08283 [Exophiala aquamarina CBS 119918]KEF55533.1 hypothetical protein A1O9_08283 [Exophiala aquamarina CBS 119918]